MKKVLIVLIILFSLLLTGCHLTFFEGHLTESVPKEEVILEEVNETVEVLNITVEGECAPQWGCLSSSLKAYQLENCSWTDRKECTLGCFNGTCRIADTCETGFKCRGEYTKAYQTETCGWTSETKCEFGCEDAKCKNETIVKEEEEEVVVPSTPANELHLNTVKVVSVGGSEHNLSLYILEESRTKVELDGQRSDWILIDGNFTFAGDINIKVTDISYQPYAGGIKAITYTIE
jgi:hypothetical protein